MSRNYTKIKELANRLEDLEDKIHTAEIADRFSVSAVERMTGHPIGVLEGDNVTEALRTVLLLHLESEKAELEKDLEEEMKDED